MDYELMMNGNVKIGQIAPEFTATTTFRRSKFEGLQRKVVSVFFSSRGFYPRVLHNGGIINKKVEISI